MADEVPEGSGANSKQHFRVPVQMTDKVLESSRADSRHGSGGYLCKIMIVNQFKTQPQKKERRLKTMKTENGPCNIRKICAGMYLLSTISEGIIENVSVLFLEFTPFHANGAATTTNNNSKQRQQIQVNIDNYGS